MKLHFEHGEVDLAVNSPKIIDKETAKKLLLYFYEIVEENTIITLPVIPKRHENDTVRPTKEQTRQITIERPTFRDRLPNNAIDVKDLDVKQAITEEALVRCPNCGQSHVLAVQSGGNVYFMRKFYSRHKNNDEFKIIAEFDSLSNTDFINMCCKEDTDRKAYFEDIQSVPELWNRDFVVANHTEIFCPVCCNSDSFLEWKNAYEEPLKYFESEHLCDACGGTVVETFIKNRKTSECDNCGMHGDIRG